MIVTCDGDGGCGQSFEMDFHEELQSDGTALQFFVCPHCKKRYPVAHISKDGLRLRQQMDQLRRRKLGHSPGFASLQRRYEREVTSLIPE